MSYFSLFEGKKENQGRPLPTKTAALSGRSAGDNNETETLTGSPTIPEDRRTRIWLGMISQEPFRIEFQRVGIRIWVVQNLPIYQVKLPGEEQITKKDFYEEVSLFAHQMFAITGIPLGMKYPL